MIKTMKNYAQIGVFFLGILLLCNCEQEIDLEEQPVNYETVSLAKAQQLIQVHRQKINKKALSNRSATPVLEVQPDWSTFDQQDLDFTDALLSNVKAIMNVAVNFDVRLVFISINDRTVQAIESTEVQAMSNDGILEQGKVFYHSLEGTFLIGYVVEDGKVTKELRSTPKLQKAGFLDFLSFFRDECDESLDPNSVFCDNLLEEVVIGGGGSGGGPVYYFIVDYMAPDHEGGGDGGSGDGGSESEEGSSGDSEEKKANDFEEKITDDELEECLKKILDSLKKINKGVGKIVVKFAGNKPGYNWVVKSGTTVNGGPGQTVPIYNRRNRTVTTTFDTNKWKEASELSWARTLLHEAVHAHIVASFGVELVQAKITYANMMKDYYDIYNQSPNDTHHAEIVRNFVGDIALALKEFGIANGYNLSDQFYNDLAWGGLTDWVKKDSNGNIIRDSSGNPIFEEAPWFKAAFPNASDRNRIRNIILIESTKKDRNGNTKAQKGTSTGC